MSKHLWAVCAIAISVASLPVASAEAQVGGLYNLSWNAIDCGGGSSAGGVLDVYVSVGQPDTGSSSGGIYTIQGGFGQQGYAPAGLDEPAIQIALGLDPARPNPTRADAVISFGTPDESHVRLRIFSADGSLVRELVDETIPAGQHVMHWDGRDSSHRPAAGGVYFVRLESRDQIRTRKLVIAR
jgi:hypothetical protein